MNHEAKDKFHLENQKIRGQEGRFQEKMEKQHAIKETLNDKKQLDLNALKSEGKENGRIEGKECAGKECADKKK